jgi:hypothetical protein
MDAVSVGLISTLSSSRRYVEVLVKVAVCSAVSNWRNRVDQSKRATSKCPSKFKPHFTPQSMMPGVFWHLNALGLEALRRSLHERSSEALV